MLSLKYPSTLALYVTVSVLSVAVSQVGNAPELSAAVPVNPTTWEFKSNIGKHLKSSHNCSLSEYYDKFYKVSNREGKCLVCGKDTDFLSVPMATDNNLASFSNGRRHDVS